MFPYFIRMWALDHLAPKSLLRQVLLYRLLHWQTEGMGGAALRIILLNGRFDHEFYHPKWLMEAIVDFYGWRAERWLKRHRAKYEDQSDLPF